MLPMSRSTFLDTAPNPSENHVSVAAVAQVVERSPEKAGVGGSTPSRGTKSFNHLALLLPRFCYHLLPIQFANWDKVFNPNS